MLIVWTKKYIDTTMRNYNSTGSRDPIWTQVTGDPEENFRISQERVKIL